MNLSHLVLDLFITFHKTLFAFVLFSGRHCVVIRSGISRVFPATMQKAAPGSSGAAYGIIRGQSFFSKRVVPRNISSLMFFMNVRDFFNATKSFHNIKI